MFNTVATQYIDVHVGDDWDAISLKKQLGPFVFIQIQNEGPYPIKCLLSPFSMNDFMVGVGETMVFSSNDAQIHHIKYKIEFPKNGQMFYSKQQYSIMNIVGSYRKKLDKHRLITAPFEPSINQ